MPCFGQQQSWQSIGPPGGDVISLAISKHGTVYLGAADGHIFASTDAGQHWALRGRVSARQDAVIQKLLVDTRDENQLFAAVWFQDVRQGGGLYHSGDAGTTWTLAGLPGEIVRAVEQSPSAAEIFVAGTRSGVFRSTDSAQSWRRISPSDDPELRNVDSLAIDPRSPETIYAGTYHLPWKTSDAGSTWNAIATGWIDDSDVMSLRVDSASPARIFASACSGIYRSENAGVLWTKLQGIPYSSRRTPAIVQDSRDARVLYAATTEGLWITRDAGESWTRATPREWVVNDLVVIPNAGNSQGVSSRILLGTEGQGILLSADGGGTFTPANEGFSHRIVAALVSAPQDTQHLLAWMPGSPDSLVETLDSGAHWRALPETSPKSAAPAEIARIFSSDAGWWAASATGVLSAFDARAGKWTAMRFVSPAPRRLRTPRRGSRDGAHDNRLPDLRGAVAFPTAGSDISGLRTIGARILVSTVQGMWSGMLGEKILRPVAEAAASETRSEDAQSPFWMVAAGRILQSQDAGKTWHAERVTLSLGRPGTHQASDPQIRWIQPLQIPQPRDSVPGDAAPGAPATTQLLVGTTAGLYRCKEDRDGALGAWHLVQSGLPAAEPVSYFRGDGVLLVTMRGGGLYLSRDASQTWERLDTGAVSSQFTGVAFTPGGAIIAASLTEGLLRYPLPKAH